jgi:hypothetical protein
MKASAGKSFPIVQRDIYLAPPCDSTRISSRAIA